MGVDYRFVYTCDNPHCDKSVTTATEDELPLGWAAAEITLYDEESADHGYPLKRGLVGCCFDCLKATINDMTLAGLQESRNAIISMLEEDEEDEEESAF